MGRSGGYVMNAAAGGPEGLGDVGVKMGLRMRVLGLFGLLAGCGPIGLEKQAADSASLDSGGLELTGISISSLDPAFAPLDTAMQVTVMGQGFEGEVRFWFGNTEVEVVRVTSEQLLVRTPEVPVEVAVDVTVRSDRGEITLPDAFHFGGEGGGDGGEGGDGGSDGGSGTDGGSGAEGLVSGYSEVGLYVVGCPECLGYTDYVIGEAYAIFHEPVRGEWMDWLPGSGRCVSDPRRSLLVSSSLDVGSRATLQGGSSGISLGRVSEGSMDYYLATGLGTVDLPYNTSMDLIASSAPTPYTIEGAVVTVRDAFDAFEPIELLSDGYYAFANFSASSARFQWAPVGVSDAMVINIQVYNGVDGSYRGEILCVASDSGSFTVPSSYFSPFYVGDLAAIWIYRWSMNEAISPVDGSTWQGASAVGLIGTATLNP
jgi:hypothetical protein